MISSIILAAGLSSRMKQGNKLLLSYKNSTIIENTVKNLGESKIDEIVIVLGHDYENVKNAITKFPYDTIVNSNYKDGISSSIKSGLGSINPLAKGLMICLGDMPHLKKITYNKLIDLFNKTKKPSKIIVPTYKEKRGNPIIFSKNYFKSFLNLKGDIGAKNLLLKHKKNIIYKRINDIGLLNDIDNDEDYKLYNK